MPKEQSQPQVGLRESKKEQTRQNLLSAAKKLFSKYEFEAVTVDQIVEEANVSQKTFFNYFSNKSQFLEEFMLDWLRGIGMWAFEEGPIEDCRSALIPTDSHETLEWIVSNRRIMKMALQHTDFLNFIYKLDKHSESYSPELRAAIREPRLERVKKGQKLGLLRNDLAADEICDLYDGLRIDLVRRWLFLRDDVATSKFLHQQFESIVDSLVQCVKAN